MAQTTVFAPIALAAKQVALGALDPSAPSIPSPSNIVYPADALYFACDLVHEGPNNNGDVFLYEEMEKSWKQLIGMAVDRDHIMTVDGAVGQIYDARFLRVTGKGVIRVAGFVNTGFYPEIGWKLRSGIVQGVSMECLFAQGQPSVLGRVLRGIRFIGMGLTRVPADDKSWIDNTRDSHVTASRRDLLVVAAAKSL